MQQFFDHFALANKTIQERLGTAPNALNKLSALYGMQARGVVQMLSYGNDMITARAVSHLLNMDIFRANDAYLLKLGEGMLLLVGDADDLRGAQMLFVFFDAAFKIDLAVKTVPELIFKFTLTPEVCRLIIIVVVII